MIKESVDEKKGKKAEVRRLKNKKKKIKLEGRKIIKKRQGM